MMKSILLDHTRRYPRMAPTDAVKLLYQSEFGGGHLIQDEEACLNRLLEEYRSTPQRRDIPLTEDIGSGIVRVNLAALDESRLSPEKLGQMFLLSAAQIRGTMASFREKLSLLQALTAEGAMPFSRDALDAYLIDYETAGFPPVSHSAVYRDAYHPAYRVVQVDLLSAVGRLAFKPPRDAEGSSSAG